MHAEHVEGVVHLSMRFKAAHAPQGRPGRDQADGDGAHGPDKAGAGVTATRPATAPRPRPSIDALPQHTASPALHDSVAAAVASTVLTKARPATALAAPAEPGVEAEPAHPQQRRAHHGQRQRGAA